MKIIKYLQGFIFYEHINDQFVATYMFVQNCNLKYAYFSLENAFNCCITKLTNSQNIWLPCSFSST